MRHASPLRYPGGKAALVGFLASAINLNNLQGCIYYEPYAGGAGAALGLLKLSAVSEIYLNDADKRIYAFWHSVLYETDRFVERINTTPLTIDEWHCQQRICKDPFSNTQFDLGFAVFFMNRCNRSGVLSGSGPIGGYQQNGKWRLDVRFNRTALAERILKIALLRDRIHLSCKDAIVFLKNDLPRGKTRSKIFVYLDPPYVGNGERLYLNAYLPRDHATLANYMKLQRTLPWIMSYDCSDLVLRLYVHQKIAFLPIRYSLQEKRDARELIISPESLAIPPSCLVSGKERLLINI